MDLWYMNQLRKGLTSIDSWPYKALGEKGPCVFPLQHHKFLMALWLACLVAQLSYIRLHYADISIFELGNCVITVLINMIDNHRITMIMTKSYRELTRAFVKEIHLFHYKHKSEYTMEVYNKMNRYCTIICKYLYVQIAAAVLFFNLMPLLTNAWSGMFLESNKRPENGTFVHGVYYALPFDIFTWTPGFIAVYIFNIAISYWVGACFTTFDFYLAALVCQVCGHLDILEHELKSFPLPSDGCSIWYSPEESEKVAAILKRNIYHHTMIVQFVHKSSTTFGPMLAMSFTFFQIGCCILLLECSIVSEKLIDAVYGIPWEYMGVRERKLVLVFLMKVQTPIRLKALGLVPVGVNTMTAILKTSVSYFVMLKTFAAE